MQQLINQITSEYDMSIEDATHIIEMVQNYKADDSTKEEDEKDEHKETANKSDVTASDAATVTEENMFQKATHFVEEHLPGGIKEKAEEMFNGIGEKVTGLFK